MTPQPSSNSADRLLNYVTSNRFYVEIAGIIQAGFTECSGLGMTIKKDVYYEGGVNDQQRVRLGHAEFSDVTLKRGLTDNLQFWQWANPSASIQNEQGEPPDTQGKSSPNQEQGQISPIRKNVNILVFNQAGQVMQSWTLIGAVPISWKAPVMQADGNSLAIEELTLAYEGLDVQKAQGASQNAKRGATGFFPA